MYLKTQLHNSTDTQVVLDNVSLASTGRYRCEVSAEAPSFQTVSDHGDMVVVGELTVELLWFIRMQLKLNYNFQIKIAPLRLRWLRNTFGKLNEIEF